MIYTIPQFFEDPNRVQEVSVKWDKELKQTIVEVILQPREKLAIDQPGQPIKDGSNLLS